MNDIDNLMPTTAAGQGETYANFTEYKRAFDTVLLNTANNFVRIGYLLKYARDTEILKESGHDSLVDFAKAEYGLDKTQVSRFIAINDRFSRGGYGDALEDRYAGFGYAKLSIMLTLPEEITEELSPEMTKSEITELKKEVEEELKITDVEVLLEGKEEQAAELEGFALIIREMVKSYPKIYGKLHKDIVSGNKLAIIADLAPNGKDLYTVRISGVGKFTVTIEEHSGFSVVNIRTLEKTTHCWEEGYEQLERWFNAGMGAEASWNSFFGSELPGEETAQTLIKPNKTAENDEKQQKTAVNSSKTDDFMPKPVESKPEKAEKEKPSRIHKPEKPKAEKKAEGDAPEKEAVKEAPAPAEEVKPVVITATEEQIQELKEQIEKNPAIGFIEVAPVQQPETDTHRIIEVKEEFDFARFGIDPTAPLAERIKKTEEAFRGVVRSFEIGCVETARLMRSINAGEAGYYDEVAKGQIEWLERVIHDFRMFRGEIEELYDKALDTEDDEE